MMADIHISSFRFCAMSEASDVKILCVSLIAPKLISEKNIASPFHLLTRIIFTYTIFTRCLPVALQNRDGDYL